MKQTFSIAILIFFVAVLNAQQKQTWYNIIGSAFVDNDSYRVLGRLCDETGGRLMGTPGNLKAMDILAEELQKHDINYKREKIKVPGWVRGDDEVILKSPVEKKLKAIALGYVNPLAAAKSNVVYAQYGFDEDYSGISVNGKIVLVTQENPKGKEALLRYEAIDIAAKHGAIAILFINTKTGAQNLAGTGNFQGDPTPIPAFSLTYEEGKWLQRLLEKNIQVEIEVTSRSYCVEMESANTVVTFPGKSDEKIVVGAHFDSWDLGQGGIDNGIGTAILFDVARLIQNFSKENYYTIELVWFNGEELGLWGSKKYVEMHKDDKIKAMINMDMTGSPTGFNAMGIDELIPFLTELNEKLIGFNLKSGVVNSPWTNSDHMPFMFAGVPTITLQAHLDEEMHKYYHEAGDTFDKVNKKYLSEAAAVITLLTSELANNSKLEINKRTDDEMITLFKKYNLDKRLKKQKEWIYEKD
ncbi:MAG: M28 family peptidase [Ignavibacteriales bacterium]|nr:MAG: M28 family peptidase [Ignavibacteriales bacterium]